MVMLIKYYTMLILLKEILLLLLLFLTLFYLIIQCFVSWIIFVVNLVTLLLLMILSYTVFPALFTRYCYNALDCAIPMNRCLIRYGSNNLGRTSIFTTFPLKYSVRWKSFHLQRCLLV